MLFVPDASRVQSLTARLLRNDGAVVYLNGVEVWRDNMPAGLVSYVTLATAPVAGSTNFITGALSPTSLVDGNNVIAVEIHQESPSGPDIAFDLEHTTVAIVPSDIAIDMANSGAGAVLRWPLEAGWFQLYTTTNLAAPTVWTRVTDPLVVSNQQFVVLLPVGTNSNQFFRLQTQ